MEFVMFINNSLIHKGFDDDVPTVIFKVHLTASVPMYILSFYLNRFARVGSVVLAIHDASDVFLEVGKMAKYSGSEWLANTSFLLFVASWVLLRLTYFPFWILRSTR